MFQDARRLHETNCQDVITAIENNMAKKLGLRAIRAMRTNSKDFIEVTSAGN